MCYYAQKLAGPLFLMEMAEVGKVPEGEAAEREEMEGELTMVTDTDLSVTKAAETEEGEGSEEEETKQPTLAEILRVVNK